MTNRSSAADKAPNYTEAQEQAIRDAAPLNQAVAARLADEMGKTTRSIIAKAVRMGVEYHRKQAVTKTGAPVEKKETIVSEIAEMVGSTLDGLEKAPKPVLQALRDYLAA